MAATRSARTNLLAGTFLIAGIVGAVLISFTLTDAASRLKTTRTYAVRFALAQGVAGVKPDSPVTLAGYEIGRVAALRPEYEPAGGDADRDLAVGMIVEIAIPSRMALYDNADIRVATPLLGSLSSIVIKDPGGPTLAADGTAVNAVLAGEDTVLNGTPAQDFGAVLTGADRITDQLGSILGAFEPYADQGAGDLASTLSALSRVSTRIDERSLPILDAIDASLADVRGFTEGLPDLFEETQGVLTGARSRFDEVRRVIDNANGFITDGREMFESIRPGIEGTVANAESITDRINTDSLARLEALLADGGAAARGADGFVREITQTLREVEPELNRTAANVRLVSSQAVQFFDEVQAAPWRLLQRPGKAEERRELLYGAARAYARSVSDLRAASASLETAIAAAGRSPTATNPEQLAALQSELGRAFELYKRSEADLLEAFASEGIMRDLQP
ncbi:MAG: hypothetical protein AAGI17_00060 [Planctomycetota bacterium]